MDMFHMRSLQVMENRTGNECPKFSRRAKQRGAIYVEEPSLFFHSQVTER